MRPLHLALLSLTTLKLVAPISISTIGLSANAQMREKCDGRANYQRLASWLGGPTGRGGYFETEICGRKLEKGNGQAEFVVEISGKDGRGKGIYSMNCANVPNGYWASQIKFSGYPEDVKANIPIALKKAAGLYC